MTRFKNVPRHEHRGFFNKAQNWLGAAHVAADMGPMMSLCPTPCIAQSTQSMQ